MNLACCVISLDSFTNCLTRFALALLILFNVFHDFFLLVDKYHLITGGKLAHHPSCNSSPVAHRDVFLARDGFSQSLSTFTYNLPERNKIIVHSITGGIIIGPKR